MKLGYKPSKPDLRDITFRALLTAARQPLPKPPARFGHDKLFKDWQMLGNDVAGDCVFAGGAHETMLTAKLAGRTVSFDTAVVLADYGAVTGFKQDDPSTDQGTEPRDALKYRKDVGLLDSGGKRHKIGAYVSIDPIDWDLLMQAVYVFGAVGIGVDFPQSAMDQFDHGEPWDVVSGSPSLGGHYVPVVARGGKSTASVITWGRRQSMTRHFYEKYCGEAWAIVYPEELLHGRNERGFNLTALNRALAQL